MSEKIRGSNNRDSKNKKQKKNYNRSQEKKLEQTTRIRVDQERLEDSESLDTSFLEGRIGKRFKNDKTAREKLLHYSFQRKAPIFKIVLIAFLCCIIIFLLFYFLDNYKMINSKEEENTNNNQINQGENDIKIIKKSVIDDNYLFVGDYYLEELDFDGVKFPYVKVSDESYQTKDILNDMNEKIYQYNPSVVFLELGMNDLIENVDREDIIDNIKSIIKGIQENRPYSQIVIESVYPINSDLEEYDEDKMRDVDIKQISELNSDIKNIVKETGVQYLDIYKEISKDGKLKEEYTDDGILLNDDGNKRIMKVIQSIIEENNEKK